jgi:hypothetical protein
LGARFRLKADPPKICGGRCHPKSFAWAVPLADSFRFSLKLSAFNKDEKNNVGSTKDFGIRHKIFHNPLQA